MIHPDHNTLIVAEADHAAVPAAERRVTENGMDTDVHQAEVSMDSCHSWCWCLCQLASTFAKWTPYGHGGYLSLPSAALMDMVLQGIEFDEERAAFEEQQGAPKNALGRWASCLRIIDPTSLQTSR